jgi:hypothetical protein
MIFGDRVRVYWEHLEPLEGVVLYVPQQTGDSWIIESEGRITNHVQMFCRMELLEKA